MSQRIEFLFDFGSPNAYLCHRVLPGVAARTGAEVEYVPVLLGGVFKLTGNASPAVTLQGIKNNGEYTMLETRRFLAEHGIDDFRANPHFPVNTLHIMRGAVALLGTDEFDRYVDEIYRHMWCDPKKLDDPAVLRAALEESGFDADAILSRTQDPAVKAQLISNTEGAVERGVFGSPSFFVGSELFFGKDRLEQVEREVTRQREGNR